MDGASRASRDRMATEPRDSTWSCDTEQVKQTTLNATKGQLSDKLEFILPTGKANYDYQIDWRLKGNKTVSSGRKSASDAVLFVDEVPAG